MGATAAQELSWEELSAAQTRGQNINPSVLRNAVKEPVEIPSLNRKGNKNDECFVSSLAPGLITKWICGSLLSRSLRIPPALLQQPSTPGLCSIPGLDPKGRSEILPWGNQGRIRKEREAFPFFPPVKPQAKRGSRGWVGVLCIPSSRTLQPAPLKASPDTSLAPFP